MNISTYDKEEWKLKNIALNKGKIKKIELIKIAIDDSLT